MKLNLKPGDRVYRVEPTCLTEPHPAYRVEWRTLKTASPNQLQLQAPFSGTSGVIFRSPSNPGIGRAFFATPEEAVEAFRAKQERRKREAAAAVLDADSAIGWTVSWKNGDVPRIATYRAGRRV